MSSSDEEWTRPLPRGSLHPDPDDQDPKSDDPLRVPAEEDLKWKPPPLPPAQQEDSDLESNDTECEWERICPEKERQALQPPDKDLLTAIYNYIKNKKNRNLDQDTCTLLTYAQGDTDFLEHCIRNQDSELSNEDYSYLDTLENLKTYLSVNPDYEFRPIKQHYVMPSTHNRLYQLPPHLRYDVLAAFRPETNETHHNEANTTLNHLIDEAIRLTTIPTRTSTYLKDKMENLPTSPDTSTLDYHKTSANTNMITNPPYRYKVPDAIISDLKKITPQTAHLLLQITNQSEDQAEAITNLRQLTMTAFYQMRENTRATIPRKISTTLTKDPQLLKINTVIKRLTSTSSSSQNLLPLCAQCRLQRQPHHNCCMNCKTTETVPHNTKPTIEYRLPNGGQWILDFTDDDVKHKYFDADGHQLNDEDTAQLISSYVIPINDKFFTAPLPQGTTEDLMCAADFPDMREEAPYDEENKIYGFHSVLIEVKNTIPKINVEPANSTTTIKDYTQMLERITSCHNTPLAKMINHTLHNVVQPRSEAKEARRTNDLKNKQHQYTPPTIEELQRDLTLDSGALDRLRADANHGTTFHPNDLASSRGETLNLLRDIDYGEIQIDHRLYQDVPTDANGKCPTTESDRIFAIQCLLRKHKGEVRLLQGKWERRHGAMPTEGSFVSPAFTCRQDRFNSLDSHTQHQSKLPDTINSTSDFHNAMLTPDDNDPENYHWQRSCTVWCLPTLFTEFGQYYSAKIIYPYYLSMPILAESAHRGRSSNNEYKRKRQADFETTRSSTRNFMTAHNIPLPTTQEQLSATSRLLGDYIAAMNYIRRNPNLDGVPPVSGHDDERTLWFRADFDHNIYVNTDELPSNLRDKFHKHTENNALKHLDNKYSLKSTNKPLLPTPTNIPLLAEMFFRCTGKVTLTTGTTLPCGKICRASSDWLYYTREGKNRSKNAWTCIDCKQLWKRTHGSRFVILSDGRTALQLILDEPPQRELSKWTKGRVQWYKRYAPNAARQDATPLLPDNSFAERLSFEDEDSDNIWRALLGNYDMDAMILLNSMINKTNNAASEPTMQRTQQEPTVLAATGADSLGEPKTTPTSTQTSAPSSSKD